ncbi:PBECR4 domain-containing protein [Salsuginibacillus halophilus]|uniref:PBECR4 domain-containing protein n=1 Tax=Salsuginibacillus halophilus TaxID=517424 RepID=UPI0011B242DB|nr:PBECR4 domain-containing protein [Salsuginibacillus halophilus]
MSANNHTIQDIAQMYHNNLLHKMYIFHLKGNRPPVKVKFDEGHLAHLIGLHYFDFKRSEALFQDLLDGKITWQTLKKRNKGNYKQFQYRMYYIIHLHDVLQKGRLAVYDGHLKADLMIYHRAEKQYLSLGLYEIDSKHHIYVPTTFMENKKNRLAEAEHYEVKKREVKKV